MGIAANWTAKTAAAKAPLQKALGQRGQPRGHYAEDVGIESIDAEGLDIESIIIAVISMAIIDLEITNKNF
jgi:hypothetical protein